MRKIYLDYAATTPVAPEVLAAMQPYFGNFPTSNAKRSFAGWGNAGSLHSFGQEAIKALDESRETIAKAIGGDFREIIFTGSATEANNLALRGAVSSLFRRLREPPLKKIGQIKIIISSIEHESIIETARDLERQGMEVVFLPVDKKGVVDLKELEANLDEKTIVVSVMSANNEIGSIEPVAEITKAVKNSKIKNSNPSSVYPLLHVDHSQGFQYLEIKPKDFGIDLMTLSSHKIYGPKGAAALYIRNQVADIRSQVTGGGQEFGLRSGTENIPAIVGFAKAAQLVVSSRHQELIRVAELRSYLWRKIKKIHPAAELNGPALDKNRLPNNLNIYFPGEQAADLLIKLDMAGIAVSAGSACSARSTKLSHVLQACGFSPERIKSSLRITLGRPTTKEEIEEAIRRIRKVIK